MTKEQRRKLVERTIETTAHVLQIRIEPQQVDLIAEKALAPGRPEKLSYSPEEVEDYEAMRVLLEGGTAKSKAAAARQVCRNRLGREDHSTIERLRRGYDGYMQSEQRLRTVEQLRKQQKNRETIEGLKKTAAAPEAFNPTATNR